MLSAIGVTPGLTSSSVVRGQGVDDYSVDELVRFTIEAARVGCILQPGIIHSEQEPAIRSLLRRTATLLGVSV